MLVLSRERGETVNIGDEIEVTVIDIRGDKVRLGVSAPRHVSVHRKEVYEAIKRQQKEASSSSRGESDPHPGTEAADASGATPEVQRTSPDQSPSMKAPPSAPPAA